ncbi:methyl-accepting chemotaxis protein [Oxynema aestuarii]|jgi:CHASE3 domain sensor protein|uniref:Chemotaxis protein n=1 Tax=Oxynema aestuarii AP17 TaxID=2064643 RepID=A0A6H1TYE0_9CYAN|nr:methyl-accepting chemotaxis protein [Oxynema aestuarii]QIZ71226.1 chemotaxis protein [Oxynema aestuarii AP17]
MLNLKLKGQILSGYAIPILLLSAIAPLVFVNARNVNQLTDAIEISHGVSDSMSEATLNAIRMERSLRGYLVNQKPRHREGFEIGLSSYNQTVRNLENQIEALRDPEQKQRFQRFVQLGEQLAATQNQMLALVQNDNLNAALQAFATDESSEIIRKMQAIYDEFLERERIRLAQGKERTHDALDFLSLLAIWGTPIAIALCLWSAIYIAARVRDRIEEAVRSISTSSHEIAATAQQQERNASQQSSFVRETTTSMNELDASSKTTAERAEEAAQGVFHILKLVSGKTLDGVRAGLEPGDSFDRDGTNLEGKVSQIALQMEILREQLGQIDKIANLVSNLAEQTNMLALNAAVEAVRAGEGGKGFGIVASEIRKLADRSRKSAEQINTLVQDIQKATQATVTATKEGNQTVEVVVGAIDEIVGSIQAISGNAREQAIAISQVVEAMHRLNLASGETATGIAQVRTGTQQLNTAILDLKKLV